MKTVLLRSATFLAAAAVLALLVSFAQREAASVNLHLDTQVQQPAPMSVPF